MIENILTISFPDGEYPDITEKNIASESMSLTQSICDESKLKFGGCIASEFDIDLVNSDDRIFTTDLVGKWISVKLTQRFPSGEKLLPSAKLFLGTSLLPGETVAAKEYYLFSGIIDSAKLDKNNRNKRHIVAYDALSMLYDIDATNKLFNLWKTYPNGYKIGELVVLCLNYNGKHIIQVEDNKDILDEVIDQHTTERGLRTQILLHTANCSRIAVNCSEYLEQLFLMQAMAFLDTSNSARVQKNTIFTKTYTQKNTIAAATTNLCLSTIIRQGRKKQSSLKLCGAMSRTVMT